MTIILSHKKTKLVGLKDSLNTCHANNGVLCTTMFNDHRIF